MARRKAVEDDAPLSLRRGRRSAAHDSMLATRKIMISIPPRSQATAQNQDDTDEMGADLDDQVSPPPVQHLEDHQRVKADHDTIPTSTISSERSASMDISPITYEGTPIITGPRRSPRTSASNAALDGSSRLKSAEIDQHLDSNANGSVSNGAALDQPSAGDETVAPVDDDAATGPTTDASEVAPDTSGGAALAKQLQEGQLKKESTPEKKARQEKRETQAQEREAELAQEPQFAAERELRIPLQQLDVTGNGHCLYYAFGVAYYDDDRIRAGAPDLQGERRFGAMIRNRLRNWWNKVTTERSSAESQARLDWYRVLNANSARASRIRRNQMETYTDALQQADGDTAAAAAAVGYSLTHLEDRGWGNETFNWQITSRDDRRRVWATLDVVQVLADAFDVQVIVHVPQLDNEAAPNIEGWGTVVRGRNGARKEISSIT